MTSYKNFIDGFGFRIGKYPRNKFEQDKANILPNMQVSSLFYSVTHSQQKVAMATTEVSENCHHVQSDPHRCKIKLDKFHSDILWCYGVVKESFPGGRNSPRWGRVKTASQLWLQCNFVNQIRIWVGKGFAYFSLQKESFKAIVKISLLQRFSSLLYVGRFC